MTSLKKLRLECDSLTTEIENLKSQYVLVTSLVSDMTPESHQQSTPTQSPRPSESARNQNKRELEIWDITPPRTRFPKNPLHGNQNLKNHNYGATDYYVPEVAHHEYFDELINSLMVEGLSQLEDVDGLIEQDDHENTGTTDETKETSQQFWKDLVSRSRGKIQLENVFRLGGITAFPVNDPSKLTTDEVEKATDYSGDDQFMGIRFDVFDETTRKYVTPHYVILKRNIKNDDWLVFKTTIPRFIPINSIATEFLNVDIIQFAKQLRKHLIQLQLKKSTFLAIENKLSKPINRLEYDLNFSKVSIKISNSFEIILICDLFKIGNVIVIGADNSDSDISENVGDLLEILLKDCKIRGFSDKFFSIMEECGLYLTD